MQEGRPWYAGSLWVLMSLSSAAVAWAAAPNLVIDAADWRIVRSESGPVNYYRVVTEGSAVFVRSRYVSPLKTAVLGWQTPQSDRDQVKALRWTWRARTLPKGGNECRPGMGDSAAVVYVTWKRGLRHYTLKYVWGTVGVKGSVCARKRNPFLAQDTVILESGPPVGIWHSVQLDLASEFRRHFADGDPTADLPAFIGLGIMSDGDQTGSESSADFGRFVMERR